MKYWYTFQLINKSKGYDGVIYPNQVDVIENEEPSGLSYIVFSPSQIKSDIGNSGDFSPESDDIRFRLIGEQEAANLDKAEGSITRIDNLSVAREMESAFNEKKKRIEKLRASRPVEITGEEYNGKYELNRESSRVYIKDNLRSEYKIKDTGENVTLVKESANKLTSHSMGNEAYLKSIIAIPELIRKGIFIDEISNEKGNNKFDSYRYYLVGLKIAGADYTARLTVGVKQGTRYYDHNLTQIEKGKLLDAISPVSSGFTTKGGAPDLLIPQGKDTKLISILQTNNAEKKIKLVTGWEKGIDGIRRYEDQEYTTEGPKFRKLPVVVICFQNCIFGRIHTASNKRAHSSCRL